MTRSSAKPSAMSDSAYANLMARARAANRERDKLEREVGFAAPIDGPLDVSLRTVMSAIEAGIRMSSWECVAEGQAMLEEIELKVRGTKSGTH